jgi:predicted DNA-binding transcriptional regulator AlpA
MLTADPQRASPPPALDQYLSVKEIVAMLDISRDTLFVWQSAGKFPRPDFKPNRRVSRWLKSTVEAWIEAHRPESR